MAICLEIQVVGVYRFEDGAAILQGVFLASGEDSVRNAAALLSPLLPVIIAYNENRESGRLKLMFRPPV